MAARAPSISPETAQHAAILVGFPSFCKKKKEKICPARLFRPSLSLSLSLFARSLLGRLCCRHFFCLLGDTQTRTNGNRCYKRKWKNGERGREGKENNPCRGGHCFCSHSSFVGRCRSSGWHPKGKKKETIGREQPHQSVGLSGRVALGAMAPDRISIRACPKVSRAQPRHIVAESAQCSIAGPWCMGSGTGRHVDGRLHVCRPIVVA